MRVITGGEARAVGLTAVATLGLLGAGGYLMLRVPALLPVWPAIGMGVAIGAMDHTSGRVRWRWARVAIVAGGLACLAIIAT